MEERYEYRTIRIERAAWRKVAEAVHGECAEIVGRAGGTLFGLWRGEIGFHNDDGVVMTAWPPHSEPDHATTDGLPSVMESTIERLVATVRPTTPEAPIDDGVYAHRWFETSEEHWSEFIELSHAAWPDFEGGFPGTRIVGLWRSLDTPPPKVRALLVTRYPTLAVWGRSRPYEAERVPGVDEAPKVPPPGRADGTHDRAYSPPAHPLKPAEGSSTSSSQRVGSVDASPPSGRPRSVHCSPARRRCTGPARSFRQPIADRRGRRTPTSWPPQARSRSSSPSPCAPRRHRRCGPRRPRRRHPRRNASSRAQ